MSKALKYTVLAIVVSALQYYYLGSMYIDIALISNLTVFMSIIFGFYITSLAIFVTSSYVSSLYEKRDKRNKSVTLLHTLVTNYKIGLTVTLFSILYLFILQFMLSQSEAGEQISYLSEPVALPFLLVVLFSFFYGYKMLNDLVRIIIQESKTPKSSKS